MSLTNKATGLVFETDTPEKVVDAYLELNKLIKSLEDTKKELRPFLEEMDNVEHNNHIVRVRLVQRKTYDKSVLREELDEDQYHTFVEPNKKAIDTFLKENLEELGEVSTILRKSMVEKGNPYTMVRLEKLTR